MTDRPVTAMSIKMVARITSYENSQLKGTVDSIYFKEPYAFNDVSGMIEIMETAFDAVGFPDKALLPRTFGKAKERMRRHEMDLENMLAGKYTGRTQSGGDSPTQSGESPQSGSLPPLCTFEIFVNFRHNAEWQGRLHCIDRGEKNEFRSIIELVRLIDEAMA